jgi:hypothetical protein
MSKYWRLLGDYNGEAQTYEAVAGALQTSPYTPDSDGKLKGIRVLVGGEAATSLVEGVQIRLSCTTFTPNVIHVAGNGNGIRTAPATPITPVDYEVDQPVKAGVPITVEGRHAVATAVTNHTLIMGLFES